MLNWMRRRRTAVHLDLKSHAPAAQASVMAGRSAPLHKYLAGRYADAVVLTFAQIEDLLGFALPELAHLSSDWWTAPDRDAPHRRFADSWIQANRTARPNLGALTVAFDRIS
jgi:hypothetical protein